MEVIITLNNYERDYETLLKKYNKSTTEIRTLRTLALQTYKPLNDLNPEFMKNNFANSKVSKGKKTT